MMDSSPHCARQWPYNENSHEIAELREALNAATALARLLTADNAMRDNRDDSGAPEEEDQPFNGNIRGGLFSALNVCVREAESIAERLGEKGGKA